MANTKFKVLASKGVSIGGEVRKKGDTFYAETKTAHVQTALHFGQIEKVAGEAVSEPADPPAPPAPFAPATEAKAEPEAAKPEVKPAKPEARHGGK